MIGENSPYIYREFDAARLAGRSTGDPRRDVIESGPLRGRRAVTLGMVELARQDAAALAADLVGFEGLRDRARSIEQVLGILERIARLPADPSTDYNATP